MISLSSNQQDTLERVIHCELISRNDSYDSQTINFQCTATYTEVKVWYEDYITHWSGEITFTVKGFRLTNRGWEQFIVTKDVVNVNAHFYGEIVLVEFVGPNYGEWFANMNDKHEECVKHGLKSKYIL